jgi:hypothetical protein
MDSEGLQALAYIAKGFQLQIRKVNENYDLLDASQKINRNSLGSFRENYADSYQRLSGNLIDR